MNSSTSRVLLVLGLLLSGWTVSCGGLTEPATPQIQQDHLVLTTFYPTTYLAQRIAGDTIPVECPVPDGEDPIFWQPSRETIQRYQKAAVILVNGAEFEKWIETTSLPESRVVNTSAGFADEFVTFETATAHSHGGGATHKHEGVDGHTWVDPKNAIRQAEAIHRTLTGRYSEHAEIYATNLKALRADLEALHERYVALTARAQAANLIASHPAYNYVSERYGWDITSLDLDPDTALDDAARTEIRATLQEGKPNLLLWESEPLPETVAALEALGVTSLLFSPAELLGPDERSAGLDYLSIMNRNLDRLAAALGE